MTRTTTDPALLERIAAGDLRAAAERLVLVHGGEVLGRFVHLTGDRPLAEDLAQDVFGRALAGLAGFRGDASIRSWLFTVVRHVWIDHLRRTKRVSGLRDEEVDADLQPDDCPLLIDLMVSQEQLARALAALDETDRALVLLRHVHGMEPGELARGYGVREGAIRMRVCRALARMRDVLDAEAMQEGRTIPRARRPFAIGDAEVRETGASDSSETCESEFVRLLRSTRVILGSPSRDTNPQPGNRPPIELDCLFSSEQPTGRDALPPLARALGLLLESGQPVVPVDSLLGALAPEIDRRFGPSVATSPKPSPPRVRAS